MIPLLLALTQPNPSLLQPTEPQPSYVLCQEMEHDVYQGVEFGVITQQQADDLIIRCLINYSTGPSAPHVLS